MIETYKEAFEKTRSAGLIAAGALDEVAKIAKPGTRTEEIDKLCFEYLNDHGTRLNEMESKQMQQRLRRICPTKNGSDLLSSSNEQTVTDESEFDYEEEETQEDESDLNSENMYV